MRNTITTVQTAKSANASPLVCLTAYTAPMASFLDEQCDILLVGDSVAMVVYGHPSTLQADMDMMIRHGEAVVRATQKALIVVDMPFGSYQESKEAAFRNAAEILRKTGADAVKIEGGTEIAETVSYLSTRGVPVMGHVGLQPQSVNMMGGYKAQGKDEDSAERIKADAQAVANAGAFAIVIEGVAEPVAAAITRAVSCPTIGIGASVACDGQILVTDDMLGIIEGRKPKFVKTYADLAATIRASIAKYAHEVRTRTFPDKNYVYHASQSNSDGRNENKAAPAPEYPQRLTGEHTAQQGQIPQPARAANASTPAMVAPPATQPTTTSQQPSPSYQRLGLRPASNITPPPAPSTPPASQRQTPSQKPSSPDTHVPAQQQTSAQRAGLFGRPKREGGAQEANNKTSTPTDNNASSPFTLRAIRRPSGE